MSGDTRWVIEELSALVARVRDLVELVRDTRDDMAASPTGDAEDSEGTSRMETHALGDMRCELAQAVHHLERELRKFSRQRVESALVAAGFFHGPRMGGDDDATPLA